MIISIEPRWRTPEAGDFYIQDGMILRANTPFVNRRMIVTHIGIIDDNTVRMVPPTRDIIAEVIELELENRPQFPQPNMETPTGREAGQAIINALRNAVNTENVTF